MVTDVAKNGTKKWLRMYQIWLRIYHICLQIFGNGCTKFGTDIIIKVDIDNYGNLKMVMDKNELWITKARSHGKQGIYLCDHISILC